MLSTSTDAWNWETVGGADFRVAGNRMELAVPRNLLKMGSGDAVDFEFKWINSPASSGKIMDVYANGEAAPSGRSFYHYKAVDGGSNQ